MRRLALFILVISVCGFEFAPLGSARTRTGSADLEMIANRGINGTFVAGQPFFLYVSVFNHGPDPSSFTIHIQVPDGVTFRPSGPAPCTGTTDVTCTPNYPAPVGDDGSGNIEFEAAAAGTYTFVVRLTDLGATDSNPANNQVSVTITVGEAVRVPSMAGFKIVPAYPRAGATFAASFGVRDKTTGATLVPTGASCRASVGRARARIAGGRAVCSITTPSSARGKVVRGVLSANAGGGSLSRRFTVRLR